MQEHATDPEHDLERTGDELEERIDHLDDEIDDSKQTARSRSDVDEDPFDETAGDWEDTEDEAGGDDPAGFDDPEAEEEDEDEDF
jgi:hypothetical protein